MAGKGCIKDIREFNKVFEYAQSCSDEGIFFSSEGIDWDEKQCCAVSATRHLATKRTLSMVCLKMEEVKKVMFVVLHHQVSSI